MRFLKQTKDGIPVGLLFSFDSQTAAVEKTQYRASLLAIEEANHAGGIAGVPIMPITAKIGPNPEDYKDAARYYCEAQQISVLFGTHMSNQRKAVLPSVEKRDALLFYPTPYEGFEFSSHCIYTGAAPNQNCFQLAHHVLEHVGKRVMFVGNNYVFAHESNRIMRDLFEQAGGTVVDETYLPLNATADEIADVLARAQALAPDALYSTVVGADTIKLYEAFAASPLRRKGVPIVSLATNEADVCLMSADVAEGHISAAPFFETLQSPESIKFVTRYRDRFGADAPITAGAESAYFQMHLFVEAAKMAKDGTLGDLLTALGDVSYNAPQGMVRIDPETHHTYLWPRIARVDSSKAFQIVESEHMAIKPEPYLIEHSIKCDATRTA